MYVDQLKTPAMVAEFLLFGICSHTVWILQSSKIVQIKLNINEIVVTYIKIY